MLDLDYFKPVNDGMGHQAGDLLLRQVADAIVAASRDSDRVFRYGGDEFAVLLPRTDGDWVGLIAERVRAAVKGVVGPGTSWHGRLKSLEASAGTASYPLDGSRAEEVLLAADRALFVAKRSGGGRVASAAEGLALVGEFTLQTPTPDRHAGETRLMLRRQGLARHTSAMTYPAPRPGAPRRSLVESPLLAAALVLVVLALAAVLIVPGLLGPSGSPSPSGSSGPESTAQGETSTPAAPTFVRPTPSPGPSFTTYVVQAGDTLNSIATAFRTTARSIAWWNRGAYPSLDPESEGYDPNRIEIGWMLSLIPRRGGRREQPADAEPRAGRIRNAPGERRGERRPDR